MTETETPTNPNSNPRIGRLGLSNNDDGDLFGRLDFLVAVVRVMTVFLQW